MLPKVFLSLSLRWNGILTLHLEYVQNECRVRPSTSAEVLFWLKDEEPFPYRLFTSLYRPSLITKSISLLFGFRHDRSTWSIDALSLIDVLTNEDLLKDGGFETNYLSSSYNRCVLSNTRISSGDIFFDLPYAGDFYYADQTTVGMSYLTQNIDLVGGRYYNLSFVLENRGYPTNNFILLIE